MELEWTGWDLNPGLPACKAGDLPLIYRPRRAHSVGSQMKLSAKTRASASESLCRECDARTWIVERNGPFVGSSA